MSQHLEHFTFDLFLSYGWAGLQGADDGDRGWIADFKRALEGQLSSELGRHARIHLDVEQASNGELPENLRDAVMGSVAFLSVIARGSVRADSWCHRELEWFLRDAPALLPNRRQLFSLLLRDVKPDLWPDALRPIVPVSFLNDGPSRGPVPRNELNDTAKDAGARLQNLAIRIARVLEDADEAIARTVLIASASPSGRPQVERLATEISKGGGTPVRLDYQEEESEQSFRSRCVRELNRASLMVCLLDDGEPGTVKGWSSSLERILIEAANLRFARQPRQVIVWRNGAGPDPDWPDAQNLKSMGFEYLHTILCQTLQTNVADAAARVVARKQTQAEQAPLTGGDAKWVFVECVQSDLERLAPLRDAFRAKGYRVKFPLFQGDAALRRREDLEFLARCRAAAVYFGSRNDLEAYLACQAMADTIADQALGIPRAVLLDPPGDPVRKFFEYPEFTNFPYNPDEFVNAVTGEPV